MWSEVSSSVPNTHTSRVITQPHYV